ncbi:kinase-like domain-containing protein, partial [Hypoxylon cercidicola]
MKRLVLREARCLKSARHHHVVGFERAFFFGHSDNSRSFMGIVMDRADENIVPYLAVRVTPSKISALCGWFQCLANVVAYVHCLDITHRDIKPPDILVKDGKVLLADFGISNMSLVKTQTTQGSDFNSRQSLPERHPSETKQLSLTEHSEMKMEERPHTESPKTPSNGHLFLKRFFSCFGGIFGH